MSSPSEELRMYILLNSSVKMSCGKAVAQAGHGICEVTNHMVKTNNPKWTQYLQNGHPKIALKCPVDILEHLKEKYQDKSQEIWCMDVVDAGRTQLEPGTMTALVFVPMEKKSAPEEIVNLKLY